MEKIGWCLDGSNIGIGLCDEASGTLTFNAGRIGLTDDRLFLEADIRYPASLTAKKRGAGPHGKSSVFPWGQNKRHHFHGSGLHGQGRRGHQKKLMSAYKEVTGDETQPQVMGGGTYARSMDNIVAFGPVFPGRDCTEHKKTSGFM